MFFILLLLSMMIAFIILAYDFNDRLFYLFSLLFLGVSSNVSFTKTFMVASQRKGGIMYCKWTEKHLLSSRSQSQSSRRGGVCEVIIE